MNPNAEEIYNQFWKPLVEVEGEIVMSRVKLELFDYYNLMDNVYLVYGRVTDGNVQLADAKPEHVIKVFNELYVSKEFAASVIASVILLLGKGMDFEEVKRGLLEMTEKYFT